MSYSYLPLINIELLNSLIHLVRALCLLSPWVSSNLRFPGCDWPVTKMTDRFQFEGVL